MTSLKIIDGGSETITGRQALAEVGECLGRVLPLVAADDPFRPALTALAYVAGIPRLQAVKA